MIERVALQKHQNNLRQTTEKLKRNNRKHAQKNKIVTRKCNNNKKGKNTGMHLKILISPADTDMHRHKYSK